MKSAGSVINSKGDISIYFKHKDKISFAITEEINMLENDENKEIGFISPDVYLTITSKDKKTIDKITLHSTSVKRQINLKNFFTVEEIIDHDHSTDPSSFSRSHRKWHLVGQSVLKNGIPDLNRGRLALTQQRDINENRKVVLDLSQSLYVNQDPTIGYYYYLANTNNSSYSGLSTKSYDGNSVFSYFDAGDDHYAVHQVGTLHSHHFLRRQGSNNFQQF